MHQAFFEKNVQLLSSSLANLAEVPLDFRGLRGSVALAWEVRSAFLYAKADPMFP